MRYMSLRAVLIPVNTQQPSRMLSFSWNSVGGGFLVYPLEVDGFLIVPESTAYFKIS